MKINFEMFCSLTVKGVRGNVNNNIVFTIDSCILCSIELVNKFLNNQVSSTDVKAKHLYSTSTNNLMASILSLAFHETKELPKKIQKPVVDLLLLMMRPNQYQYGHEVWCETWL